MQRGIHYFNIVQQRYVVSLQRLLMVNRIIRQKCHHYSLM